MKKETSAKLSTGLIFVALLLLICGFKCTVHGFSPRVKDKEKWVDRHGKVRTIKAPENVLRDRCLVIGPILLGMSLTCFGCAAYIDRRAENA
jgi:hypothetical protein